jgi:two-component system chemotaxis response regulator CheY
MNILVVDDSRATRAFMRRLLEAEGWKVSEAADGQLALAHFLFGDPVDLALVDWNMPVMNGLELIETLRARPEFAKVKLVMMTSETETNQMARALEAGANDYMMKPFLPEALIERVRFHTADQAGAGA